MQREVRYAIPPKVIDQDATISASAVGSKRDTDLGDRLAIQIRQAPANYPIFAWFEGKPVTIYVLEPIVCAVGSYPQTYRDAANIGGIGDDA